MRLRGGFGSIIYVLVVWAILGTLIFMVATSAFTALWRLILGV